ncbi:MAG TPA: hypothetical protein VFS85_11495, partial [Dongiaceae bacterium]|nr:hypothetical protein [Dongiaceae bacterium]
GKGMPAPESPQIVGHGCRWRQQRDQTWDKGKYSCPHSTTHPALVSGPDGKIQPPEHVSCRHP